MSPRAAAPRADDWRRRARVAFAAVVGTFLVRVLASTWRMRMENREVVSARRAAQVPIIFAAWHGELLPLLWAHRREGVAVVVSMHADGEIIARILEALGFATIRGSTSRGGARALLEASHCLRDGIDVAMTPDGPRGPRRQFTPGAVVAAMRSGAPVIAVGAIVNRAWRLRSWDRFVIPKPFAEVRVRYSAPTFANAGTTDEAEREAPRFAALIDSVCAPDEA